MILFPLTDDQYINLDHVIQVQRKANTQTWTIVTLIEGRTLQVAEPVHLLVERMSAHAAATAPLTDSSTGTPGAATA